ncbi:MAG: YfhO family protein [Anaerolineae bacterium]
MGRLVERLRRLPHGDTIGASLLLMALLVVFFWRAVFLGESLLPVDLIYELDPVWQSHAPPGFTAPGNRLLSDQVYMFYPWKAELRRRFSERQVPLWTPSINCGQPMMGNGQAGVWDPFWLLASLVPLNDSFFVVAVLRLWVGGVSTFLLARQVGIGRRGATLAMIAFAFSGPMIVWLGYPLPNVMAWLPLLLYLSERALAKQSLTLIVPIGIVLAWQFFGGHPGTCFHVVVTWAFFCLARAITRYRWQWRSLGRMLGGMALAGAIGVSLSAIQLLPLAEGILNSSTLVNRQAVPATGASLLKTISFAWHHWPSAITTLLPQFFGTPIDNSYWYPYENYNEQTAYVGIVPLALGILTTLTWWYNRRRKEASPNSHEDAPQALFIGWILLALGVALQFPLFNIVNTLPVVGLINHGRVRMVYALGLALLAGYGLDMLARVPNPRFSARKRFLCILAALAIINLLCVGLAYVGVAALQDQIIAMARNQVERMKAIDHPQFPYSLEYYYDRVNARYRQMRQLYTPATPQMFVPVGMALAVGLLELSRRRGGSQRIWLEGLVLLTCADLFTFGMPINPTMDRTQVYPTTEALEFLRQQPGVFRVGGLYLALMPNSGMVFDLSDVRGCDPIVPWRQANLLNHIEGATRVNHYGVLRSASSHLLDLMNVQYMVTDRELDGRWELVFEERDSTIRVYRNHNVLPRAFIVYQAEYAAGPHEALARLLEDTFDPRTKVILEGATPGLVSTVSPGAEQARIVRYEPERVVIEKDTSADGFLVLTDTYAPGWQVQVDGQPAELYIADYAFRAVRVPAGRHRVEFVYAPSSFAIGVALSLAAAVCCMLWGAVLVYRRVR